MCLFEKNMQKSGELVVIVSFFGNFCQSFNWKKVILSIIVDLFRSVQLTNPYIKTEQGDRMEFNFFYTHKNCIRPGKGS